MIENFPVHSSISSNILGESTWIPLKILELMEEWTGKFSIINFYLAICAKTDIRAYMADNLKLLDIGKPETLAAAEEWLRQNI